MDANDNDRLPSEQPSYTTHSDHPWYFWVPSSWREPDDPPARRRELTLHAAAAAFLAEYETYQKDPNSVIFNPTPAVLEALRKAVQG